MLAQHLHHTSIRREVVITSNDGFYPAAVLDLEDVAQAIRVGFVRAEEPEVALLFVAREDVAHHFAELTRGLVMLGGRLFHVDGIVGERRQVQVNQQLAAVGRWGGAYTPLSLA